MNEGAQQVRVVVVGAGFAADFHLASYQRIYGVDVEVVGIASRTRSKAEALAKRYGVPRVYSDLSAVLEDPDVNVVDLCVPVHLHGEMAVAVAKAGKHVICEKPLVGYVGQGSTPKMEMYRQVVQNLNSIRGAFESNGVRLLYAENWIYAPAIRRGMELMEASGGTILDIRGYESHSGSASEFSKRWETSGGGALLRLGIHPLSVAIYLKQWEGLRRGGKPIHVRDVYGQVANLSKIPTFQDTERQWLATGWQDVENWSLSVLTFEDDTVAVISASDIALGGVENGLEVYLSNARVKCNLDPNTTCQAYAPDPSVFAGVFLNEKLEAASGWSFPTVDHEWVSGYQKELQDFAEAVATDRPPVSGLDLAEEVITVAYALYVSAEWGRRVSLRELNDHL
ncbi:MAG: Gfo/Idh/MocA family oxidoreductase [Anaerolineae bacterium]|nr:Gfo/Idh/MocA family oxidoreductase [Anaerolineae bacterium]